MPQIYEPKGKAREYSPLALNYFKGCDHGCKYCYVPNIIKPFNLNYVHHEVNLNIDLKSIESSAKKFEGCGKQILLSFTTDPYNQQVINQTREVLEILNKYNHLVAILTKAGTRVLRDIEIFKKFGSRIKIGSSLTFDNEKDSKQWEYRAALPNERIEMLRRLKNEGIKTWVSFEPVIYPEQTLKLIEMASFVDHIKIGKINNYLGIDKKINWTKFLDDAVKICRSKNIKFYIKNDLLAFNNGTYISENESNMDFFTLKHEINLQTELF